MNKRKTVNTSHWRSLDFSKVFIRITYQKIVCSLAYFKGFLTVLNMEACEQFSISESITDIEGAIKVILPYLYAVVNLSAVRMTTIFNCCFVSINFY